MLALAPAWLMAVAMLGPPDLPEPWLTWEAPSTCPDAGYVAEATVSRLGRTPSADEVRVRAIVEDRASEGLHVQLHTTRDGETDVRTMTAHDCLALADASALVIALSVDPIAVAETITLRADDEVVAPPVPPAPPDDPEPAPPIRSSPVVRDPTPAPASVERRLRAVTLRGAGGIELGALPGVSGGPGVAGGLAWRRLRLELGGWYLAPRTERTGAGSVSVQGGAGSASACGRLGSARVELPLCAGLEVGALRGAGSNAPQSRSAAGLWLAPVVGGGAHIWVIPRLAVTVRVDLAVPVARPAFDVRDPGDPEELHRPAAVSGRLWLGIEGKLWARRDGSTP